MLGYFCKIKLKTCLSVLIFLCVCIICIYYYPHQDQVIKFLKLKRYIENYKFLQLIYRSSASPEAPENKIPILLWWTPFMGNNEIISCQNNHKCIVTKNRIYATNSNLKVSCFFNNLLSYFSYRHRLKNNFVVFNKRTFLITIFQLFNVLCRHFYFTVHSLNRTIYHCRDQKHHGLFTTKSLQKIQHSFYTKKDKIFSI